MSVVRYVKSGNGIVQRRHIKHIRRFRARYMRGEREHGHYVNVKADYREKIIEGFDKWAQKNKLKGFTNQGWRGRALKELESTGYNVERNGEIHLTGFKGKGYGKGLIRLSYDPSDDKLKVVLRDNMYFAN